MKIEFTSSVSNSITKIDCFWGFYASFIIAPCFKWTFRILQALINPNLMQPENSLTELLQQLAAILNNRIWKIVLNSINLTHVANIHFLVCPLIPSLALSLQLMYKIYPGSHGKILLAKSNGVFFPAQCSATAIDMMIHKLCKCAG